ncbi:unnamed protein product, partial [Musa hybrid cultivar]
SLVDAQRIASSIPISFGGDWVASWRLDLLRTNVEAIRGLVMDGTAKRESHLPSARTPVEGGVQDACGDACSIRLEPLCEIDPSTVPEKISVSHVLAVHRFEGSHLVHMNWPGTTRGRRKGKQH